MRLATWNLLSGRSPDDGAVDLARLGAAAASLDADVLALQEVDRGQPRSHHADLTAVVAEATGAVASRFEATMVGRPPFWWPATADAPDGPAYGVALVSRHPVTAWDVVRLPPGKPLDEQRVALVAEVTTPQGPLTAVCTHLSFLPWSARAQLAALVEALADRPRPLALLGDLNLTAPMSALVPAARVATFPAHAPRRQLDHVLLDGLRAGAHEARRLPVSDHCALVVDAEPGA